jgi:hypothetical protein
MDIIKYTSIQEVFAKIHSDSDIGNEAIRITDWVTWAGEALKKIGAFPQFVNRISGIADGRKPTNVLRVSDYRCLLPCDLHTLLGVSYSVSSDGPWQPTRRNTGIMDLRTGTRTNISNTDGLYPPGTDDKIQFVADIFNESYSQAFTRINSTPNLADILNNVFKNQSGTLGIGDPTTDTDITWEPNGPYLDFSRQDGYVVIAYKAMPTDQDGYPMIPDVEEIKEAIYWYIEWKLLYPQWKAGKIRDAVYHEAKMNWKGYRLQSYGELMMPSITEYKAILNIWMRTLPNINEDMTNYKYTGQQQRVWNS